MASAHGFPSFVENVLLKQDTLLHGMMVHILQIEPF